MAMIKFYHDGLHYSGASTDMIQSIEHGHKLYCLVGFKKYVKALGKSVQHQVVVISNQNGIVAGPYLENMLLTIEDQGYGDNRVVVRSMNHDKPMHKVL